MKFTFATKNENPRVLAQVEKLLKDLRGYTFKMPPPGSTVVAMASGGLDTTVVIGMLLEKYHLNVIPIYFDRYWPGDDNSQTLAAAKKIISIYQARYPNRVEGLKVLTSFFPSKEIVKDIEKMVWERVSEDEKSVKGMLFEMGFFTHVIINYLRSKKRNTVRTIFLGINVNDTRYLAHHSLTSLRSLMLHTCIESGEYDWQISSLPLEISIGNYLDKFELIKIGKKNNFPIFESITCRRGYCFHCGKCPLCDGRRESFAKSKVVDKTTYESDRIDMIGRLKKSNFIFRWILKKV